MALAGSFSCSASANELAEMMIKVTMIKELIKKNLFRFPLCIYKPPLMFIFRDQGACCLQYTDDRSFSNLSILKSQRP
jgi:hypothetical protein